MITRFFSFFFCMLEVSTFLLINCGRDICDAYMISCLLSFLLMYGVCAQYLVLCLVIDFQINDVSHLKP